jgi:hypothetical protein
MLILTFHNDSTGVTIQGNYNVKVYVNEKVIYEGRVEGHDRRKGWVNLVRMFLRKTPKSFPSIEDFLKQEIFSKC